MHVADDHFVGVCRGDYAQWVKLQSVASCVKLSTNHPREQLSSWAATLEALPLPKPEGTANRSNAVVPPASAGTNPDSDKKTPTTTDTATGKTRGSGKTKDTRDRELDRIKENLTAKTLALKAEKTKNAKLRQSQTELEEQHAADTDKLDTAHATIATRDKENKAALQAAQTENKLVRERERSVSVVCWCQCDCDLCVVVTRYRVTASRQGSRRSARCEAAVQAAQS